jgi:hypothetical protein
MTNKFGRIIAVLLMFTVSTFAVDYNKVMNDRLKKSLGNDFKDYQSISFPTTNFGLITSYTPTGNTSKPKDSDFFCDTWDCLGLGSNVPTDLETLKSINGFAAVGDSDAVITLSDTEKSDLGFKALLPKIAGILNIGGSFDQKKTVVSELQLGPFYIRKLRRDRMAQYINGLPSNNAMKQAYLQGRLLLIVADVVSTNMSVKVKVDADTAAKIDAKIGAIPTGSVSSSFSDASFGFNIERGQTGEYTFKVTRPVVVLRLAKRQPAAGVLGAENDNDWKDWIVTKIPKK